MEPLPLPYRAVGQRLEASRMVPSIYSRGVRPLAAMAASRAADARLGISLFLPAPNRYHLSYTVLFDLD